jgi:hypothetical protein
VEEDWIEIDDFPGYLVSTFGEVYNERHERKLTASFLQNGIPTVGMWREGRQYRRSIPVLVAEAWVPNEWPERFNTPTHLNGDRSNCRADNLVWRPRWFAIKYHKEILTPRFPDWPSKNQVLLVNTQEVFRSPREPALKYGLREMDIFLGMLNKRTIFPNNLEFQMIV